MPHRRPQAKPRRRAFLAPTAGEALLIVGQVGSGKSFRARHLLRRKPRLLAYDQGGTLLGEPRGRGFTGRLRADLLSADLGTIRRIARRRAAEGRPYRLGLVDEPGANFLPFLGLVKDLTDRTLGRPPSKELAIWIEEASHPLSRFKGPPELLNRLLRTRRHRRLAWLVTTQYPSDLPLEARRAFDRIAVGRTTHAAELAYLKRQGFTDSVLKRLPGLAPGWFFEWEQGEIELHGPVR